MKLGSLLGARYCQMCGKNLGFLGSPEYHFCEVEQQQRERLGIGDNNRLDKRIAKQNKRNGGDGQNDW